MKILYLGNRMQDGTGSFTYQQLILKWFAEHHFVKLFNSLDDLNADWDIVHILDIKHFNSAFLKYISRDGSRMATTRGAPTVIVDIHDYYWLRFYPFLCPDLPLRYCLQKYRSIKYPKLIKIVQGWSAPLTVIVHSKYVYDLLPFKNKYLLPLGIEPDCFAHAHNDILETAKREANLILFVGRDYFRKGLYTILKALPLILDKIPDAKLLVVGKEYMHSRVIARILANGLPVTFINGLPRDELLPLYKKASVFVLPSSVEASSFSLLEAMAGGTPVVATNVGGIPELVSHRKNGLLVERGDYKSFAKVIIFLLKNQAIRDKFIEEGYKIVREKFSSKIMCANLEVIYQDIITKSKQV